MNVSLNARSTPHGRARDNTEASHWLPGSSARQRKGSVVQEIEARVRCIVGDGGKVDLDVGYIPGTE